MISSVPELCAFIRQMLELHRWIFPQQLTFVVIVPSSYMASVPEIIAVETFKASMDTWWAEYPNSDQYKQINFDWRADCTFIVHVECNSEGIVTDWPFGQAAGYVLHLVKLHCDARGPGAPIVVDIPHDALGSIDIEQMYLALERSDLIADLEIIRRKGLISVRGTSPT